jgi:hypothetical protein
MPVLASTNGTEYDSLSGRFGLLTGRICVLQVAPPSLERPKRNWVPVRWKLVQVTYTLSRSLSTGSGPTVIHGLSLPSSCCTTTASLQVLPPSVEVLTWTVNLSLASAPSPAA